MKGLRELMVENAVSSYAMTIERDVRIPTSFGSLSVDLVLPRTPAPVPALITLLPYRKDLAGQGWFEMLQWFAERGFAGVLADLSGTGASDGAMRPKMSVGEGEDAIAIIDWARSQPWSSGRVGMWGASSGGFTTLRAASMGPDGLEAIIPMVCPVDPVMDAFSHDGARVDLHQLGMWSASNLLQRLIPPLAASDERSTRRWWQRLEEPPAFVDFAEMRPGDQPDRAIDVAAIGIPTFCIGGWYDLYADAMVRMFERLNVPKQAMFGPWFHNAPFGEIDFKPIALEWWDRWLRDAAGQAAAVVIGTRGESPAWLQFDAWPAQEGQSWYADSSADSTLSPVRPEPELLYEPDPTSGALAGLWGIPNRGFGLPLDGHDDDMRALVLDTAALSDSRLIFGRASVSLASAPAAPTPTRIVVRISDVDPAGRSTFIAAGVLRPARDSDAWEIALRPTAYRIAAGHRLRLAISDSDFPRLVPLVNATAMKFVRIGLTVPFLAEEEVPAPPAKVSEMNAGSGAAWSIARDPLVDRVTVSICEESAIQTEAGHDVVISSASKSSVVKDNALEYLGTTKHTARVQMASGEVFEARVTVRSTQDELASHAELLRDRRPIFVRDWRFPLLRETKEEAQDDV